MGEHRKCCCRTLHTGRFECMKKVTLDWGMRGAEEACSAAALPLLLPLLFFIILRPVVLVWSPVMSR